MTNETGGSVVLVTQEDNPSFLDNSIDLKKLSRKLAKISESAIVVLEKLLTSDDEKVRLQAATKILDLDVSVKEKINSDHIQRLIAEIKLNRGPKGQLIPLKNSDDEKVNTTIKPIVDFSNIRSVD